MALGIETNSIAPQLIQNSGQALVQGIRQIGQQISGHLTEMQTKRDLASLAQETQMMNPQSVDFPVQLTQLVSRHPLASRDERGQMVLNTLGKAHGAWQASQADALAFQRQMQMQGVREQAATSRAAAAEQARASRPVSVFGVGLVDPLTGETVVAEGTRGGSSSGAKTLSPGSILVDPSGKKIAENPRLALPAASEARLVKKGKIDLLGRQYDDTEKEYSRAISRIDSLVKQKLDEGSDITAERAAYFDNTAKLVQQEAAELKKRKDELLKALENIGAEEVEPELGAAPSVQPSAGVLPSVEAIPQGGFKTKEEVRAAARKGVLPQDKAIEILRNNFGLE